MQPTFSVWRELGGGTTKDIHICNMPERLLHKLEEIDVRKPWEKEKGEQLSVSVKIKRILYLCVEGSTV